MWQDPQIPRNIEFKIAKFAEKNPLYTGPRPIAAAKKKDLVALSVYLPEANRQYYADLTACGELADSGESDGEGSDENDERGVE